MTAKTPATRAELIGFAHGIRNVKGDGGALTFGDKDHSLYLLACLALDLNAELAAQASSQMPLALDDVKHCDDYITDPSAPEVLRWFLLVQRMPATARMLARKRGVNPVLFATYKGERYRVTMASRLGDVGISKYFAEPDFYAARVAISDLSDFAETP